MKILTSYEMKSPCTMTQLIRATKCCPVQQKRQNHRHKFTSSEIIASFCIQNTKHKCRGRDKLQRAKPGDSFCPRQNGVYPSPTPSECDKFYSCLNGVGSVQGR